MKIFPEKDYSIELKNNSSLAISELKSQTLSEEQFFTNWDSQAFSGKIEKNEFKVKLSKKLIGEFCVIEGKLDKKKGILKLSISTTVKFIFIFFVLFAFSGIITAIVQNELEIIFDLIMTILVMRFIFLELAFRYVSKRGITKLTETIGIKKTNKNVLQSSKAPH
jgi:hypothetical protein